MRIRTTRVRTDNSPQAFVISPRTFFSTRSERKVPVLSQHYYTTKMMLSPELRIRVSLTIVTLDQYVCSGTNSRSSRALRRAAARTWPSEEQRSQETRTHTSVAGIWERSGRDGEYHKSDKTRPLIKASLTAGSRIQSLRSQYRRAVTSSMPTSMVGLLWTEYSVADISKIRRATSSSCSARK